MSGVRTRFLNRDEMLKRLTERASRLVVSNSNVLEVGLFGSIACSTHGAGSDADIYIVLKGDERRFVDRIPEFLEAFSGVGVGVDVLPYTLGEITLMWEEGFIRSLMKNRVVLAAQKDAEGNTCSPLAS